ncbi:KilA-N domain-containing protein [Serratia marcescens]|uniref:KilA-N domain-containing protein n=1 Tax=Serratia marcescens TaxID=615 RepID=UPI0029D7BDC8|nr:KilA-N domain-containing protein [Serratia marcescens]MDX6800920.1 KilA-N domain-containing protein [Serratia marcescens]
MNNLIVIEETAIRQDSAGRYCLNDLHRAAGGEERHKPKYWYATQQTQELVQLLTEGGIPPSEQNQPISVIRGGLEQGSYACKELVYSYAMWISAAFNLKVIRTFDAVQTASPMTELEMIALMATKAAEQQRQMDALQLQVSGVTQQIEEISTGAIPPGWQTVRNLVAESGLSDGKVRALISAFHVPSKKIPFNAPGGILTNATVAKEDDFMSALGEVRRTATRACRSKYWYHPRLGRFEMKELHD